MTREPEALKPYEIRIKPNWIARIGMAALLLLMFAYLIHDYQTGQDNHRLLLQARTDRLRAEQDRRDTVSQLNSVQEQLTIAVQQGAASAKQQQELVGIIESLEQQVVHLGGTPIVPSGVASLPPLAPGYSAARPTSSPAATTPSYYRPSGPSSSTRPSPTPGSSNKGTKTHTPSPTESSPMPAPLVSVSLPPLPGVPSACVLYTVCVVH